MAPTTTGPRPLSKTQRTRIQKENKLRRETEEKMERLFKGKLCNKIASTVIKIEQSTQYR